MLTIKSTPPHNFDVDIKLYSEIDPEYMIGRINKNGEVVMDEVEAEIDGKQVLIRLVDCFIKPFEALPALNWILRQAKGKNGKEIQKLLCQKYKRQIASFEKILIYQYELLEIGE